MSDTRPSEHETEPTPGRPARTSKLAVVALLLCLFPLTIPIGVALAAVAILRIRKSENLSGTGLAKIGISAGVFILIGSVWLMAAMGWFKREGEICPIFPGQIHSLASACNSYYEVFNAYPGPVDNPPTTDVPGVKMTGSQNLRLALLGWSREDGKYQAENLGPADLSGPNADYHTPEVRKHEPFWNPKPGSIVKPAKVSQGGFVPDANWDDAYADIDVIVDFYMQHPRPIFYYRASPKYIDPNLYQFDDNALYCDPAKGETEANWTSRLGPAQRMQVGFILISPGQDRKFFTDDDLTNLAE